MFMYYSEIEVSRNAKTSSALELLILDLGMFLELSVCSISQSAIKEHESIFPPTKTTLHRVIHVGQKRVIAQSAYPFRGAQGPTMLSKVLAFGYVLSLLLNAPTSITHHNHTLPVAEQI